MARQVARVVPAGWLRTTADAALHDIDVSGIPPALAMGGTRQDNETVGPGKPSPETGVSPDMDTAEMKELGLACSTTPGVMTCSRRFTLLLAGALLTACAGGDAADRHSLATPQSVAKAIGCTYGGSDIEEDGVKEGGSCGDELRIFTFATNENRDGWFAVAQDPGRKYLVGDKWVVSADSAATLKAAREKIGGEID
jgi:hypothetical protein